METNNNAFYEKIKDELLNEFKTFTVIPHPSDKFLDHTLYEKGRVWKLSCYLKDRIEKLSGLKVEQDKYANLWFDVPANDPKYAKYPLVAIQAHMDMVFSYDENQFPIAPKPAEYKVDLVDEVVNGKRQLHSRNYKTTIGADDGIGVSLIVTLSHHKEIKHGPLRCILTNCEENACQGAGLLVTQTNPYILKDVKYMINLDAENIGEMFVGCSGAVGSYYEQTFKLEPIDSHKHKYILSISEFLGGHSGLDINAKKCNSVKFMTDLLSRINSDKSLQIANFSTPGATVYNKICSKCVAEIATLKSQEDIHKAFVATLRKYKKMPKPEGDKRTYEYMFEAENWDAIKQSFSIEPNTKLTKALSLADTKSILALQKELPYGIIDWPTDKDMDRFVGDQTSANIGPVSITPSLDKTYAIYLCCTYSRSSISEKVEEFDETNRKACHKRLGKVVTMGLKAGQNISTYSYDAKFPAWPNNGLKLSELAKEAWIHAGVPADKVSFIRTHAGIENSWWDAASKKVGMNLYQTAIGPQLYNCHEITEACDVDSITTYIKTAVYMLQNINKLEK